MIDYREYEKLAVLVNGNNQGLEEVDCKRLFLSDPYWTMDYGVSQSVVINNILFPQHHKMAPMIWFLWVRCSDNKEVVFKSPLIANII